MSVLAGGCDKASSYSSIAEFGCGIWLGDILQRYNDDKKAFHFSYPLIIRTQYSCIRDVALEVMGEDIFVILTTT